MTIQVGWGNTEKTYVLYTFDGAWTWQEFHAANDIALRLAGTVSHSIQELIDMRSSNELPVNESLHLNIVSHVKAFMHHAHTRRCKIIVVGSKPVLKALWDTFRAISGLHYAANVCFVRTMDEALAFLEGAPVELIAS